jgi:hypothetical protein
VLYARKAVPRLKLDLLRGLSLGVALVAPLLMLPFFADLGRLIYLLFAHVFIFAATMRGPEPVPAQSQPAWQVAVLAVVVLIYAGTWRVPHIVHGDERPMRPGPLVELLVPRAS